jgi:hypothetical protein
MKHARVAFCKAREESLPIQWIPEAGGIEVATATTVDEFIEALRLPNPHWWEGESQSWIFRGHAHEAWQLLPLAWRPDNRLIAICRTEAERRFDEVPPPVQLLQWMFSPISVPNLPDFGHNDAALKRALTIETTAECLPLWEFTARCDELGMPVPLLRPGPDLTQDLNWLAGGGTVCRQSISDSWLGNLRECLAHLV